MIVDYKNTNPFGGKMYKWHYDPKTHKIECSHWFIDTLCIKVGKRAVGYATITTRAKGFESVRIS